MFARPSPLAIGASRSRTPVPVRARPPARPFWRLPPVLTPLARPQIVARCPAIYRAALPVVLSSPAPTPLPASSPSRGRRPLSLLLPPRAAAARCRHVQMAAPCRRCADEPLVPSSAGAAPAPCCPHGGAAPTRCPLCAGTGRLDASRGTRVCLSAIELQWPDA